MKGEQANFNYNAVTHARTQILTHKQKHTNKCKYACTQKQSRTHTNTHTQGEGKAYMQMPHNAPPSCKTNLINIEVGDVL